MRVIVQELHTCISKIIPTIKPIKPKRLHGSFQEYAQVLVIDFAAVIAPGKRIYEMKTRREYHGRKKEMRVL